MSGELIVEIGRDGKTTIEVKGVVGASCKDLTASLEKALGKVSEVKDKPEINQRAAHGRTLEAR